VVKHLSKTIITKFTTKKTLNSKEVNFLIGNNKIGVYIEKLDAKLFDMYYTIVQFNSNDESGGEIEFEANTLTSIQNNHLRPQENDLYEISRNAIVDINEMFRVEYRNRGFIFMKNIIPLNSDLATNLLKQQIKVELDRVFP